MWHRKEQTPALRLFFATDIHGSERCFRKWLNAREAYSVDVLILGGDITGKALVPITDMGSESWRVMLRGETFELRSADEVKEMEARIHRMGYYAMVVTHDEKQALESDPSKLARRFKDVMRATLERWMELADERIPDGFPAFAMLGNDDHPEFADILRASGAITYAEGRILELPSGAELLSCGYSNRTPWDSPRELDEEELAIDLLALAGQLHRPEHAVFNLHCPPRDTHLDLAPVLDANLKPRAGMAGGVEVGPVGSSAVRSLIEEFHPVVGLHGHVHECAAGDHLGSTLCINPGSEYLSGRLRGALVELNGAGDVRGWQLTEG